MFAQQHAQKRKRRTAIWVVFGLLAALAVIVSMAYLCSTGRFSGYLYRHTGSGKWLYSALYHGVRNGDSTRHVEELLGPGKSGHTEKLVEVSRKMARMNPAGWPRGVQDEDVFLGFALPGGTLHLQFRRGRLINFDPGDFAEYEPQTALSR